MNTNRSFVTIVNGCIGINILFNIARCLKAVLFLMTDAQLKGRERGEKNAFAHLNCLFPINRFIFVFVHFLAHPSARVQPTQFYFNWLLQCFCFHSINNPPLLKCSVFWQISTIIVENDFFTSHKIKSNEVKIEFYCSANKFFLSFRILKSKSRGLNSSLGSGPPPSQTKPSLLTN